MAGRAVSPGGPPCPSPAGPVACLPANTVMQYLLHYCKTLLIGLFACGQAAIAALAGAARARLGDSLGTGTCTQPRRRRPATVTRTRGSKALPGMPSYSCCTMDQ